MAIAFRSASAKATDGTDPYSVTPDLPASMVANDIVILARSPHGGTRLPNFGLKKFLDGPIFIRDFHNCSACEVDREIKASKTHYQK